MHRFVQGNGAGSAVKWLQRLKKSLLVHIAYKTIYTRALEKRYYSGMQFENEMKESWGKVIKWGDYMGEKEAHELFIPNISSKEELRNRLEQLFDWIEKNLD